MTAQKLFDGQKFGTEKDFGMKVGATDRVKLTGYGRKCFDVYNRRRSGQPREDVRIAATVILNKWKNLDRHLVEQRANQWLLDQGKRYTIKVIRSAMSQMLLDDIVAPCNPDGKLWRPMAFNLKPRKDGMGQYSTYESKDSFQARFNERGKIENHDRTH